jgi:hypothetical protein
VLHGQVTAIEVRRLKLKNILKIIEVKTLNGVNNKPAAF